MGTIKKIKLIVTDFIRNKYEMGRMKRQRRYKTCDPFSQTKNKKKADSTEVKYNLAPKKCDEDNHFGETKSFKRLQTSIQNASSNVKRSKKKPLRAVSEPRSSKKVKKEKVVEKSMGKLPNETKKNYFERLDQNIHQAINTTMMEAKTLRKKRKLHLKARNEKKKLKKQQPGDEGKVILKDHVEFGERVDAPPAITAAPRKSSVAPKKYQDLKLMSILGKDATNETSGKKRKLTEDEKESLEVERQRAIDAYRLLKKRKAVSLDAT